MHPNTARGAWLALGWGAFHALLLTPAAHGRESTVPGPRYGSARAAAMGDAILPLGTDPASGLFENPAAIPAIEGIQIEPLNMAGMINGDALKSASPARLAGLGDLERLNRDTLRHEPGTWPGGGTALLPNLGFGYFAAGVLAQTRVRALNDGHGTVHSRARYELVPAVGTGIALVKGILRLGYVAQWVNMAVARKASSSDAAGLSYFQDGQQGHGFSHNAGFAMTLPIPHLPALNIVGRNIGGLRYRPGGLARVVKSPSATPATEPMSIDGSLSWVIKTRWHTTVSLVGAWRDVAGVSAGAMPAWGRLATGAEVELWEHGLIRAGWGSLHPSLGVGVRGNRGELSVAWFTDEVGMKFAEERERVVMAQFRYRIF